MYHASQTITVYNRTLDAERGCDVYRRTVLQGAASWFCRTQTAVESTGGLLAADEYTVRIETDVGYLPPRAYAGAAGTWTLSPGDMIVLGEAAEESPRPAELIEKYSAALTVVGVTDNRSGHGPHFKVVGK